MTKINLLPNILSFSNLISGFLAIIFAIEGNYGLTLYLVLLSALFDLLDGRVARKIGSDSSFGKQMDSLADLTSFGVAPGVIFYLAIWGEHSLYSNSVLYDFKVFGILISLFFTCCSAFRLARFNIIKRKSAFSGLPTTIAGPFVILITLFPSVPFILDIFSFNISSSINDFRFPPGFILIIYLFVAVLMISKIPYGKASPSFLNFSKNNSAIDNILNIFVILSIIILFKYFFAFVAVLYLLSPLKNLFRRDLENKYDHSMEEKENEN